MNVNCNVQNMQIVSVMLHIKYPVAFMYVIKRMVDFDKNLSKNLIGSAQTHVDKLT